MKKVLIILFMFGSIPLIARDSYYYKGQQVALERNTQYLFVMTTLQDRAQLQQKLGPQTQIMKFLQENGNSGLNRNEKIPPRSYRWAEVKFNQALSENDYDAFMNALKSDPAIVHVSVFYKNNNSQKIGLSNYLNVKLRNASDLPILEQYCTQWNLVLEGQNKFMPLWYNLSVNKQSTYDALHAANALFETGMFAAAEPDLMTDDVPSCVNDPSFTNQWGLLNTGQGNGTSGIDMNACQAWDITKGSASVVIAVLDHGFEMNHPDLAANVQGTGFDTESGTTPAQVLGDHGTACAGIVAAIDNNGIGVSGVAPNCRIMSISNSLAGTTNSRIKRADGINWAYQNGAAVISNSWSSATFHQVIDDAISDALTLGRGGLGTCVVFATANDNLSTVSYPASAITGILATGAMSPCGERKNPSSCDGENWWGSNYGTELDIVAPGVLIPTTDRQGINGYNNAAGTAGNYTQTFNGTSSATPHVAGLCGLIMAANPCLTRLQVNNIIERTAQKVGGYSYVTTAGRSNGTWNNQMGYGLADANAATIMARTKYLQNLTNSTTITHQSPFIRAGFNVNPFLTNGNYLTTAAANVSILASESVDIQPGTDLLGTVNVQITAIGNCNTW